MKRLIRKIVNWAYTEVEVGEDDPSDIMERQLEKETMTTWFCRVRPKGPGISPEHVHQTPSYPADHERYRAFGWMVQEECYLPGLEYQVLDGNKGGVPDEGQTTG